MIFSAGLSRTIATSKMYASGSGMCGQNEVKRFVVGRSGESSLSRKIVRCNALIAVREQPRPLSTPTGSTSTVGGLPVQVYNEEGSKRVLVTKHLPGDRWLRVLEAAGCRIEVCLEDTDRVLHKSKIKTLISNSCDGVIGQLTEDWCDELFSALQHAGGTVYSNYADGYNNVDLEAATKHGIPVGNTPGIPSEPTAEVAAALTLAAGHRVVEADNFLRANRYKGWLPTLLVGNLLQRKTVGVIGAGRIGSAYARMMVEGHKTNLIYYDLRENAFLEEYVRDYSRLLEGKGEQGVTVRRAETVEEVLQQADVVSLHCNLNSSNKHMIGAEQLALMKDDALLVNTARGPLIDEIALVEHLKAHPNFRVGLDVLENEPLPTPGLTECDNAVILPHIASASFWTRAGMATLAACNVAGFLQGYPVWPNPHQWLPFVDGPFEAIPKACPSIVNSKALGLQSSASVRAQT